MTTIADAALPRSVRTPGLHGTFAGLVPGPSANFEPTIGVADAAIPCASMDPEIFHPEGPWSQKAERTAQAKRACLGCDIRTRCLQDALLLGARGIWGGLDETERSGMKASV